MCDWESLTTSCKSGDRFDGGVWALPIVPPLQHIQPMVMATATFRVALMLISSLLFIIVLQLLSSFALYWPASFLVASLAYTLSSVKSCRIFISADGARASRRGQTAFETLDLTAREFPLLFETPPVCMSCDVISLLPFRNTNLTYLQGCSDAEKAILRTAWLLVSAT